jgi:hypothetical protein
MLGGSSNGWVKLALRGFTGFLVARFAFQELALIRNEAKEAFLK